MFLPKFRGSPSFLLFFGVVAGKLYKERSHSTKFPVSVFLSVCPLFEGHLFLGGGGCREALTGVLPFDGMPPVSRRPRQVTAGGQLRERNQPLAVVLRTDEHGEWEHAAAWRDVQRGPQPGALSHPVFGWEGSPRLSKMDYRKKLVPTYSKLSTGGPRSPGARGGLERQAHREPKGCHTASFVEEGYRFVRGGHHVCNNSCFHPPLPPAPNYPQPPPKTTPMISCSQILGSMAHLKVLIEPTRPKAVQRSTLDTCS